VASALQPTLFSRIGAAESGGPDVTKAMERAGRYLALRARSEHELTDRLLEGGFDEPVVREAMERLRNLRLVDDLEFAREWIEHRSERKQLGATIILHELSEKGVDPEVARRALAEAGIDEESAARAWALKQIKRLSRYPLEEQGGRLINGLVRRGFTSEVAEAAARSVLPPEGWD
jgi:regulatory protein